MIASATKQDLSTVEGRLEAVRMLCWEGGGYTASPRLLMNRIVYAMRESKTMTEHRRGAPLRARFKTECDETQRPAAPSPKAETGAPPAPSSEAGGNYAV